MRQYKNNALAIRKHHAPSKSMFNGNKSQEKRLIYSKNRANIEDDFNFIRRSNNTKKENSSLHTINNINKINYRKHTERGIEYDKNKRQFLNRDKSFINFAKNLIIKKPKPQREDMSFGRSKIADISMNTSKSITSKQLPTKRLIGKIIC